MYHPPTKYDPLYIDKLAPLLIIFYYNKHVIDGTFSVQAQEKKSSAYYITTKPCLPELPIGSRGSLPYPTSE